MAFLGVSDHGGWAVLVTAASEGTLLDRRHVELVDADLPKIPHHSEGQRLQIEGAVALVERVRASAVRHARLALEVVANAVPARIEAIALRRLLALPPTIAERIRDYKSSNVADWVMYRQALAEAAVERGWIVHEYDTKTVLESARRAMGLDDLDAYFLALRKSIGPPWDKDHKLAMAAAIEAGDRMPRRVRER